MPAHRADLMLCSPKINGMKAKGIFVFLKISALAITVLGLIAVASFAGEQKPAAKDQASSIPALKVKYNKDTLTISWSKSATNWMLSTQSIDAKRWSFVSPISYKTNAQDFYMTMPLPDKTKYCRLIKVPPGFRNRTFQPAQPPGLPPLPKPGTRVRPTNAPPHP